MVSAATIKVFETLENLRKARNTFSLVAEKISKALDPIPTTTPATKEK